LAEFFSRIVAREAARGHVPGGVLELFEERLPAMAAELAAGA
jgi:hypothetical protein